MATHHAAAGEVIDLETWTNDLKGEKSKLITKTIELFGRLDILVNNAGSLSGSDYFLQTTPAQWEQSFRVNLLGPMMFSQAAITEPLPTRDWPTKTTCRSMR